MQTNRQFSPQAHLWLNRGSFLLILIPAAAVLFGVAYYGLLDGTVGLQWPVVWKLTLACGGAQLLSWAVLRRWLGAGALALGGVVFWSLALVYYAGPQVAASTLMMLAGSLAITSFFGNAAESPVALRALLGLALLGGAIGWLLPFPLHDARIYLPALFALCAWRRNYLADDLRELGSGWRYLAGKHPLLLAAAVLLSGFASLGLWLPSVNYDDQSAHLILQNQLLRDGYYHFDIFGQAWAVSPWFNNAIHGVSAVLAGEPMRAAVNTIWLLVGITGAYRLARVLGASEAASLMATAVYASHPLTAYFGTTLQVDGATSAVLLHLFAELAAQHGRFQAAWKPGVLIGLLLALKITNVVYLFGPCAYIVWMAVRYRQWRWLVGVVGFSLMVGSSSYVYAWLITGNPVFPMFNTYFKSPFYPLAEFSDPRWHSGLDVHTLWNLTFKSSTYMEAYPGAAGIALFGLLGGIILALLRHGPSRWITAWCIVAGIILFAQVQYLRYVFPAIAITGVAAVAAIDVITGRRFALGVLALTFCAINTLLMPTTSWIMYSGAWDGLVTAGRDYKGVILSQAAPQQVILSRLKSRTPDACVLLADSDPFIGSMPGNAISISWYDPQMKRAMEWSNEDSSGLRWKQTIDSLGVSRVLISKDTSPALRKALVELGGRLEDQQSVLQLWSIEGPGHPPCRRDFVNSRDRAHRLMHPWDFH